ncbi:MAG: AMP-binding protein [Gammaproteobacteria bacterium]|nr:AMP-binding protein [Gammaproteobacteria bacterium]
MADWHFATALERVADTIPDRDAMICGDTVVSWREYEQRAARLAAALVELGVPEGAHIGLYLHNCNEYLEGHFATFKLSGCPINVNYRYKAEELVYLLDNADVEALIFQSTYAERIAEIRHQLPKIKCFVQVDDGSGVALLDGAVDFEAIVAQAAPLARSERKRTDLYMLYTGGTTGMPKGVMYNNGDWCRELIRGYRNYKMPIPETVDDIPSSLDIALQSDQLGVSLAACPLMHGTGIWIGALTPQLAGSAVLTIPALGLDADRIWREVERRRVTHMTIVGDAFARPLLKSLDEAVANGTPFDLSSMRVITSSGVMWSMEVKQELLHHHDFVLVDAMGSSEGTMGGSVVKRGTLKKSKTASFKLNPNVRVFTEDGRRVEPGSGENGMIATPSPMIGYYKDPEKTAATIREIDGVHYVIPGDFATVDEDGSIVLLGRGSMCINTAGEKVFPEEVEEVIKKHPAIADCLVVGVPDERFGQRVVAVLAADGAKSEDDDALYAHARSHLAGYKLPKDLVWVEVVQRAPNGKADYKWAKSMALDRLQISA